MTSCTCFPRMTWSSVNPAVSGEAEIARFGGREKISFRKSGKWWKRWNVGREASMAVTIGAAKLGAESADTEELKEKAVIVSMAKQRKANIRSDSLPSCPFFDRIDISVSAWLCQSLVWEIEGGNQHSSSPTPGSPISPFSRTTAEEHPSVPSTPYKSSTQNSSGLLQKTHTGDALCPIEHWRCRLCCMLSGMRSGAVDISMLSD